jgi:transcriptional regulator with XRE-family HTH domain
MPNSQDPVVSSRHLRADLRAARESSGFTRQQVGDALDWSLSKVSRIEDGNVRVSITDLRALLGLYGITDHERIAALEGLSRSTRGPAYYEEYKEALDPDFRAYLSYEQSASHITGSHLAVPGLLQTEDYTQAILAGLGATHTQARRKLRAIRQAMLLVDDGPSIHYIVGEETLRRQVGGHTVMRDQLTKLQRDLERPNVTLGIIPLTAGAYPSMFESFTLLRSPEWDEDVLFRESTARTVTDREDRALIAGYRGRLDRLREMSLPDGDARELMDNLIKDLRHARLPMDARRLFDQELRSEGSWQETAVAENGRGPAAPLPRSMGTGPQIVTNARSQRDPRRNPHNKRR